MDRFVIHWGVPQSIPHYYQETGRAGHDRCMSYCKIYCSLAEMHSSSETFLHGGNKNQLSQAALLAEIKQSLTHTRCRHVVLSKHFGQIVPNCMTKCDFCKSSIQMSPSVSNFNW
ncbi:ATP-dependent DNA helicase Q5-like [Copidosoma floridanum]|uniref:ATP-dependent DNA helicase Q5-like n=1 Tax=Copidosoma floridanum TaxID=29053 RepID=UPI0006C940B1|nr:ATP-dependent DNA helicase Q5-like [Copidosoma floridanum]